MRIASILLIFFVILCTGCADNEPPKKDVAEKPVADEPAMKLERENPIYTSLPEIFIDVTLGYEDKWKDKWVIFEALVTRKNEKTIFLFTPNSLDICHINEDPSNPQLYKYEVGQSYYFSARVKTLHSTEKINMVVFKFEDKGKTVIPPGYAGIIDIDFQEISDDVTNYNYEKWVGKRIRFRGKVSLIFQEEGKLHVGHPEYNIFSSDDFGFIISGFDPNGERIRSYESRKTYDFTVKIEGLSSTHLMLTREFRLEALVIEE